MTLILATQTTRLFPLVFKNQLERTLRFNFVKDHLGDLIIFFLIIYCYRDFSLSAEYILRLAVGGIVFFFQWFKGNALLSIFAGTALYMLGRAFLP